MGPHNCFTLTLNEAQKHRRSADALIREGATGARPCQRGSQYRLRLLDERDG